MFNEITKTQFGQLMQSRKNFSLINIAPNAEEDFLFTPRAMIVRPDSIETKIPERLDRQVLVVLHSNGGNRDLILHAAAKLLALGYKHLIIYPGIG